MVPSEASDPWQRFLGMYRKGFLGVEQAMVDQALFRREDVIWHCYDALEFFWKALHWLLVQKKPAYYHMPQTSEWHELEQSLAQVLDSEDITRMGSVFRKWGNGLHSPRGGPSLRLNARYSQLEPVESQRSDELLEETQGVGTLVAKVRRGWLFDAHRVVGILTRFYDDHRTHESPPLRGQPGFYPHAHLKQAKVRGWKSQLSRRAPDWRIGMAASATMRREFLVIVNPFGESYPEHPTAGGYPGYAEIRSFVFSGGLLVLAGGHPFHYYRDVITGSRPDTSLLVWAVSTERSVSEGVRPGGQSTPLIVESWFDKDFGVEFLWDNHSAQPAPAMLVDPRNGKDIAEAQVFRPVRATNNSFVRPLATASLGTHDVWPIALIRYGSGSVIHFGFDLGAGREPEFEIVMSGVKKWALDGFLDCFPGPDRFAIAESVR